METGGETSQLEEVGPVIKEEALSDAVCEVGYVLVKFDHTC